MHTTGARFGAHTSVLVEVKSSGIRRRVDWYIIADVSEETAASVFRI